DRRERDHLHRSRLAGRHGQGDGRGDAAGEGTGGRQPGERRGEGAACLLSKTAIELENSVAAELAGTQDAILKTLEDHLDCTVHLRGNVLALEGDDIDVDAARGVVDELAELIENGYEIAPGTIEVVASALDQHKNASAVLEDVVWRHRDKKVTPK